MFRIVAPLSRFALSRCPSVQLLRQLRSGEKIKDSKLAKALQGEIEESVELTIKNILLAMTSVVTEQDYGTVIAAIDENSYNQIFLFVIRITSTYFANTLIPLVVPNEMLLPHPVDIQAFRPIRDVFAHMIRPCVVELFVSSKPRLNGMMNQVGLMTLYRNVAAGTLLESVRAAKGPNSIMDIFETDVEKQELYFLCKGRLRTFNNELNFDVDVLPDLRNVGDSLRQTEPYYICVRQVYEIRPNERNRKQSTVRYLGCELKELMTVDDRRNELTGATGETIVYKQGDSEVTAAEFTFQHCQQSFLETFRNVRVDTPPNIEQFMEVVFVDPDQTSMAAESMDMAVESMETVESMDTMASDQTEMASVQSGESVVSVEEFAQLAADIVIEDFHIARFKGYKQLFVLLNNKSLYLNAEGVPTACREDDNKVSSVPVIEYDWGKHKISKAARKQLKKRSLYPLSRFLEEYSIYMDPDVSDRLRIELEN